MKMVGKISKLCEHSSGAVSEAIVVVCIDGRLEQVEYGVGRSMY